MKKAIGLALSCCVAVFSFGCGGGDGSDPDPEDGADTDQPESGAAEDRRQGDGISFMRLKGDWTPRPSGYIDMKSGNGMNMITAKLVADNAGSYEAFREATVELSKNVSLKPEVTEETDNAGQAWIIKLETEQKLLDKYRPTFDEFVGSVRFE